MATRKQPPSCPFPMASDGFKGAKVICGFGGNLQRNVRVLGQVPEWLAPLPEKRVVHEVAASRNTPGLFNVRLDEGDEACQLFTAVDSPPSFPAGGSVNMGFDFLHMGVQGVGVILSLGMEKAAGSAGGLVLKTEDEGGPELWRKLGNLQCVALPATSTSFTLCVRDEASGRTWLLCQKGQAEFPSGLVEYIVSIQPELVVFTSVRPAEWPLVKNVLLALRRKRVKTVLVPNPTIITAEWVKELRALISAGEVELDALWMNAAEAALVLGGGRQFEAAMVRQVANIGAKVTVVTMGATGAVYMEKDARKYEIVPALQVRERDPSGAGDAALTAFLICWYFLGKSAHVAMHAACWVGGRKASREGPTNGVPSGEALQDWLSARNTHVRVARAKRR